MFYGAGSLYVCSKDLGSDTLRGENLLHPLSIASFELSFEDNNIEAKALIDGRRQVVASAITESIATLTLTYEYNDWQTLGLAFADEVASVSTNIPWTSLRSKKAELGVKVTPGPEFGDPEVEEPKAVIEDTGITGDEEKGEDVMVYISSQGTWGDRKYLKAEEFELVAGKIFLDPKYEGAIVQYTVPETYSTIETIGLESQYDQIGRLHFQGVIAGTEAGRGGVGIIIPQLTRISTPSITVNGDLSEMTVEYRAEVPDGKRVPYEFYNFNTATV